MKWRVAALTTLAIASASALTPARSQGLFGPLSLGRYDTYQGASPACTFKQSWRKQPTRLDVESITLTGTVSCATPLEFAGGLYVSDAVLSNTWFRLSTSTTNGALSLRGTWVPQLKGMLYHFEFLTFFDPQGNYVGWPDQCRLYEPDVDIVGGGPPLDWSDPYYGCTFEEDIYVPPSLPL